MSAAATEPVDINPSTTRLGWIGTGVMGVSMCTHLLKAGYTLTVFNRTISKAQPLVDLGATIANSPQSLAAQSDVVFTIVGYPSDVRSVSSAVLSSLRPGGILVDMTTSDPTLAAEIASEADSKNCFAVDAPVSGGDRGAKNGTLAIFAGGDRGIVYAHKAGLDVSRYLDAISTGAAGSKSLDLYGGRILKRDFAAGFYVNHFVKDLGICLSECQKMGLALPGLALAQQLYLSLKAHGEGDLGTQALILALERLNNVKLKAVKEA
ncbi:unnamed protein product [Rhodiola kirilowii]